MPSTTDGDLVEEKFKNSKSKRSFAKGGSVWGCESDGLGRARERPGDGDGDGDGR